MIEIKNSSDPVTIIVRGALYFVIERNPFVVLFLLILGGMIAALILSKKGVGDNRWRWITLFATLAFAIVFSCATGNWGAGQDGFGDAFPCCARFSTILYFLEAAGTFFMWRRYRNP